MRRPTPLLLLAALVGGLCASAVHHAAHAAEWAEAQEHRRAHHGADGAHAPCVDGDAHALDCAVCPALGAAVARAEAASERAPDASAPAADAAAPGARTPASAPARGPPTVA